MKYRTGLISTLLDCVDVFGPNSDCFGKKDYLMEEVTILDPSSEKFMFRGYVLSITVAVMMTWLHGEQGIALISAFPAGPPGM